MHMTREDTSKVIEDKVVWMGREQGSPMWKDQVHDGPESRPCGVVWGDHERHWWGGLWARMGWCYHC